MFFSLEHFMWFVVSRCFIYEGKDFTIIQDNPLRERDSGKEKLLHNRKKHQAEPGCHDWLGIGGGRQDTMAHCGREPKMKFYPV